MAFDKVLKGSKIHSFLGKFFLLKSILKSFHSLGNLSSEPSEKLYAKLISSIILFKDLFIDTLDKVLAEAWQ